MNDDIRNMNGMDDMENVTPEIVDNGPMRCCPWKALKNRDGLVPTIASTAIMVGVIAVSCYGQYLLTKWACKAAIRETRR
ncbi:hypothetical protein GFD17_09160 [Bifidobacterium sp. SMB2]|uniref:Uncharacterized protein n=1 Tax=Bifidobacterium saimiriisciurei TaxID=2661627 RepID=A0ABX0CGK3_9BIFI|nr:MULTISPECIES: hypothetical protein [Bifidobacterium]NEG96915.1 hypothetical protein [Bifidobacterium sp. SMB2]NEH11555.1 hypothetical protein [Bifidobacterium saimiriisciurei]